MAITIENAIRNAVKHLKTSGMEEDTTLDAEALLAHVLHCDRTALYVNSDMALTEEDTSHFMALVQKRASREPLQYITGHAEFMSLDFIVNQSVLIPRPETEFVVESVIRKAGSFGEDAEKTLNILDLGTGCGNIAVSLAVNLENVRVYASDISSNALEVARTNAARHNVTAKTSFLQGNLFEAFKHLDLRGRADFIVSNPPYVAETERTRLQPEIVNHEPGLALFSGRDGLIFYRRIFTEAAEWLATDGYIVTEMGEGQADGVAAIVRENRGLDDLEFVKDLQKINRVLVAHKKPALERSAR